MKITNNSTKNNVILSIKKGDWSIAFDQVSIGPVPSSLSFWVGGVFTGLIKGKDAKKALKLLKLVPEFNDKAGA